MSATQLREATRPRSLRFDDLLAPGTGALFAVAFAGFTLGFFAWYAAIVPRHRAAESDLGLIALAVLGPLAATAAWIGYARYFSRRTGITQARSLRYDALTWLPFWILWLTFLLPPQYTHGARLLLIAAASFCVLKALIAARFNQTVREVLLDFLATRAAIIVIAELAAVIIGQRAGTHVQESRTLLLAVWGRWDAVHYLDIATHGYQGYDMAFFPLYPFLIRVVGSLAGSHLVAGLLISNAAFFFALLFLYKLLEHEFDRPVARRAIFYVSVFPTAVFFSAVYTESLFFMLTVASFYYLRAHRWWLAGVIGFFAALTRVEGILLAIPFLIEWASQYWPELTRGGAQRLRALFDLIPVTFAGLGLGVYMAYLWVLRADPLYFSHVQTHWNRHFAMPWVSVWSAFHKIAIATSSQTVANQLLEIAFTALMIGVLVAGWHSLRPSYIAYMALSILVPMCTSSLMSMPRFALVLFPMFAILARWGERPWVNNLILAFSLPLLGLFTVLFADWYWVA
ncbi:MAG: glycosyltransferase family 39 protein [Candidatus Eremiobacteraeota bacterium]|nr:glycosyltransferase family 39 protein [Candidatus Eremiobacteraeota bacterium]